MRLSAASAPLLAFGLLLLLWVFPSASASQTIVLDSSSSTAQHASSIGCSELAGQWSNATSSCYLSGQGSLGTNDSLTILPGTTLVVDFNATLSVDGKVFNNGSAISSTGTISVSRTGEIFSTGVLGNNYGVLENYGLVTNGANGSLPNYGVVINAFGGVLNNSGSITNDALVFNTAGSSTFNSGDFTNAEGGTVANFGTFQNSARGSVTNAGAMSNGCGGSIGGVGKFSGNPPTLTCREPSSAGVASTSSTIPEFPAGAMALTAFATLALGAVLFRKRH